MKRHTAYMTKKLATILFIFFLASLSLDSYSQTTGNRFDTSKIYYLAKDTSIIPKHRLYQHTEFLNGIYNFPAKPRNQWEIGVKGGLFQVSSDLPAKFFSPGFGLHVRKSLGYVFSLRLEYLYGIGKGQAWRATENYAKNPGWGANILNTSQRYSAPQAITGADNKRQIVSSKTGLATSPFEQVYYNYKTKTQDLSLQALITLNNIRFHKAKTVWNVYGFAGIGATIYDTRINALNNTTKYDFNTIVQGTYETRRDKLKELKSVMDDSYETAAENHGERRPKLFGSTFKPSATVGMGMALKLSRTINIAIEDRWTFIKDDLLDGQRWQEQPWGDAALTRDFDSYNYLSIGLNFNLGAKKIEPLWWINPLEYPYQEIRKPVLMRFPTVCPPDSDGDGITDQFDMEQTPAGCPVDRHGVSLDTDGDGVPDCKDYELITPTYCQPVNDKGIGTCPCRMFCE